MVPQSLSVALIHETYTFRQFRSDHHCCPCKRVRMGIWRLFVPTRTYGNCILFVPVGLMGAM